MIDTKYYCDFCKEEVVEKGDLCEIKIESYLPKTYKRTKMFKHCCIECGQKMHLINESTYDEVVKPSEGQSLEDIIREICRDEIGNSNG